MIVVINDLFCRNCGKSMEPGQTVCSGCGVPAGTGRTFCPYCGNQIDPNAVVCVHCSRSLYPAANDISKSRLVAGLLGVLLGSLGIHNFYLGYTSRGIIQLVITIVGSPFTCGIAGLVTFIWGLIEGIQILNGNVATDSSGRPLKD